MWAWTGDLGRRRAGRDRHHERESIEAHLTIVLAALVVTRCICTIQIRAGRPTLTAEDPLPTDLRNALALIKKERGVRTPRAKKRRSKRRDQI
jgi:hypothetical protein